MKLLLDRKKEYGVVLDGGGARGAYQIGAWKALKEAGIRIHAVAGTSVGALNGALICMDDLKKAQDIWKSMTFSKVMNVDDGWMEGLFEREHKVKDVLSQIWSVVTAGGIDVTPLKELIHELIDEEKIRQSGKEFYLLTFSLTDFKELDLGLEDIPEGRLEDFLLASAYLLGFKNEKMGGKRYIDGGVVNNVPLGSLVKRGCKDIIEIRIYGPGREPRVKLPEDAQIYRIGPRVRLGSILEFDGRKSRQNMKIGYYDAKRMLYGLEGLIYYIDQDHAEVWYENRMKHLSEIEKAELGLVLKLKPGVSDKLLYLAMLEAGAKLMKVPKYHIYTVDELREQVAKRYEEQADQTELPGFMHTLIRIERDSKMNLKGRNFLTLKDFTPEEITYLIDLAADLKEKKKKGIPVDHYRGKNVALIFEKTSTRTRCAFEVAAHDMGMGTTYLDPSGSQIGKKESIEDTARVLGRMFDGIEYRGFGQDIVEDLQKYSGVPVWNGLTDVDHPTQVLADFMTMEEHIDKKLDEMKLTFVGDLSDNVMYALMYGSAIMGVDFKAVGPKETVCDPKVLEVSQELAKKSGATITISHDPEDVKGSDVIYTDIWVSMGESEDLYPVRVNALSPYKVTTKMMKDTGNDKCLFMHCLPAYHDFETSVARDMRDRLGLDIREVEDEVFRSENSVVFDEAENRMHSIKAVMVATLGR